MTTKTPKGSNESETMKSEETETQTPEIIPETTPEAKNLKSPGTSTYGLEAEIVETPAEDLPPIEGESVEAISGNTNNDASKPDELAATVEDCQALYGLVMETAHSMAGTKKGKGHRDLPEARRKSQGELLHRLSLKYDVKIPTELELVIFGGSIIADWRYMTTVEDTEPHTVTEEQTHEIHKENDNGDEK